MERRQIVAAIIKIANELDEMGMYSEANQLTKVAQAAGSQFMKGLKDVGEGTMRGIKGLGRDIGKGLESGYEATKQGFSDAGELLGNMGSEAGYGVGSNARELGMGSANISNSRIDSQINTLKTYVDRKSDPVSVDQLARTIDSLIMEKIDAIQNGPGAQTQAAKNEVIALQQKAFQVRELRKKVQPRSGAGMAARANEGQIGQDPTYVNNWIANRIRGKQMTKGELYELAIEENGLNFANTVSQNLNDKNITRREQIVK